MYSNIEKEYKKNNPESDFNKYYWKWAIIIIIIFLIISNFFPFVKDFSYLVYVAILIISVIYYIKDFKNTLNSSDKQKTFGDKIDVYKKYKEQTRMDKLLLLLKKYNFTTKNNLKIVIDYYNRKRPIVVESSILGWIVSISLTLASFVEIAYDKETGTIDSDKVAVIFGSTLGIITTLVFSIIVIKWAIDKIRSSKTKLYSSIEEDLTHIYLNFDNYKNQLNKNLTSKQG